MDHRTHGTTPRPQDVDVVVVGAGFAGLYMLYRLRQLGFSTRVIEAADDVGGTWYWNRYPGARCDIVTTDYTYSFDPELEKAWTWSEKYATQPEILRYAEFITERYDLRRDIDFGTRVAAARWDSSEERWHLRTESDERIRCRHYVMATGCLSQPKALDIAGVGYKAELKGKEIHLALGFSHPVVYPLPDGVSAEYDAKGNRLTVKGADKHQIGLVAAEIRKLRPPEPYKGKGIKYAEETIRRKQGKTGAA